MTPVRYAVVGLGHISQAAILPAFSHTSDSELVAVVSGDPDKREVIAKRHRVERVHHYDDYNALLESGDIDAVYIALPNHLHCDYAVRAAERGIHVLCEKPMAVSEGEGEHMIRTADEADVRLMVAKRLHFESTNLQAVAIARSGELGELRYFESSFSQNVTGDDIRLQPIERGGGTVFDMGLYCVDAARYLFADEPIAVVARSVSREGDERFRHCDEATTAVLEFPDGRLASFTSSFSATRIAEYRLVGTSGQLLVHKAFEYNTEMSYEVFRGGERVKGDTFPPRDQFAPEIDYFSRCVLEKARPEPDGNDGLADVRIVRAIHESALTGRAVSVEPIPQPSRPSPEQERSYPAVEKPEEIHASAPSE